MYKLETIFVEFDFFNSSCLSLTSTAILEEKRGMLAHPGKEKKDIGRRLQSNLFQKFCPQFLIPPNYFYAPFTLPLGHE